MSREKYTVEMFFTLTNHRPTDAAQVERRVRGQLGALIADVEIHRCEVERAPEPPTFPPVERTRASMILLGDYVFDEDGPDRVIEAHTTHLVVNVRTERGRVLRWPHDEAVKIVRGVWP